MNIYVYNRCEGLTNYWHDGGGAVVIAPTRGRADELIRQSPAAETFEVDGAVDVYPLAGEPDERVWIFPDAGCC